MIHHHLKKLVVSPEFSLETSCCNDEIAFFSAAISASPPLEDGGKSKIAVGSTSSTGIFISIGTPSNFSL